MPESKVVDLRLGVLIEFDSKNDFVLGLDSGDGGAALQRSAADVRPWTGGLSFQ